MDNQPPQEIWVTLTGEINQYMVNHVFQFFTNVVNGKVSTVHLLLQSGGGFVGEGICIYNYLSNLPLNIIAYNMGNVSSMAVPVYLASSKRIASEEATFMIHKTHASPSPGVTAAMLKEIANSLDIDNARVEAILHKHITLPKSKWALHKHGNFTFTAKEGMDFALVHELGVFAPPPNGPLFNVSPP